jgi:hypothetical protein
MSNLSDPHESQAGAQLHSPYAVFEPDADNSAYAEYRAPADDTDGATAAMTRQVFDVQAPLGEASYEDPKPANLADVPRWEAEDHVKNFREVVTWNIDSQPSPPWDSNAIDGGRDRREPPGS